MNRREFFGAGAGIALGAAGVEAKEKVLCSDDVYRMIDAVEVNEYGREPLEWSFWYSDKPELELGHSARIKVQRYPGAKFVPVHRERDLFNQFVNRFRQTHWWNPDFRIESIEPIITNCIMGS